MTAPTTAPETTTPRAADKAPWDLPYSVARVDLLPPEVVAGRRLVRVQQGLAAWLVLVVLVAGGLWWVSQSAVSSAADEVAAEQQRTATLTEAQSRYAAVPVLVSEVDRLEGARAASMVSDVLWYRSLEAVRSQAPEGVWLKDLSVATAVGAQDTGAPAAAADPLAEPAVATITFNGAGGDYDDVAAWLDALTDIDGFSDARYSIATRTGGDGEAYVEFSSTVGVTDDALSHRYDIGGDGS